MVNYRKSIITEISIIILVGVIYVGPVLYISRNLSFRLDGDYDAHLPILHFIYNAVRTSKTIPLWNPYVGTGIPVIADPSSVVLNPILTPLILIFGADWGLRWTIFFSVLATGVAMWMYLRFLGVQNWMRVWGAVLFMVSGTVVASVVAGHIPEYLSYPLIPLFLMYAMREKHNLGDIVMSAIILTLVIYNGDFAIFWLLSIVLVALKGFYVYRSPNNLLRSLYALIGSYLLFILFSSPKLLLFLRDVWPTMKRYFPIDPYKGSLHVFLFPLPFVVPFQVSFYDRPFFQRLFGFHFNWYEYYSFITPLPFVILLKIKKVLKHEAVKTLLFLLVVGSLYVALKYQYSPFYWLYHAVPLVRSFRVPQRMYMIMTPVVIALLAYVAQTFIASVRSAKRKRVISVLCVATLLWTFIAGQLTFIKAFEPVRTDGRQIAKQLRQNDQGNFYVASFVCCMQTILINEKIPILNYYYSWRPDNTPNFINATSDGFDFSPLETIRPTYIIAKKDYDFSGYFYTPYLENGIARVWKTDNPTIMPRRL